MITVHKDLTRIIDGTGNFTYNRTRIKYSDS